jgi:dihydroxyacetone kinase
MGSADDMEQGGMKKQLNSYVFRRRLSLAGIGIALIGVGAIVTFVVMHMNGKSLTILNLRTASFQAKQRSHISIAKQEVVQIDTSIGLTRTQHPAKRNYTKIP